MLQLGGRLPLKSSWISQHDRITVKGTLWTLTGGTHRAIECRQIHEEAGAGGSDHLRLCSAMPSGWFWWWMVRHEQWGGEHGMDERTTR